MTYNQQLRHPKWMFKRKQIKKRDGHACVLCKWKIEKDLHVHHLYYIQNRMAWEYPNDALQTLCRNCHIAAHKLPIPILKEEITWKNSIRLEKSKTKK